MNVPLLVPDSNQSLLLSRTCQSMSLSGYRESASAHVAWRAPCFELFLDDTGTREHYYQIVSNVAHVWLSMLCREFKARGSGGWWKPDWTFRFVLGETSGTFEASLALEDVADELPEPGTIWGCQIFRSKTGTFSLFSGTYDMVGGEHASRQFGRIVFE